ncbi:hypothetical protein EV361DRAFT_810492 [Lentinula raphanica]|nr:hypothetical protein EV361DRAFT_810492 [Lentinula raphanica]
MKRNIKTTRALITVSSLKQAAFDLQVKLSNLSSSQPSADIHSTLSTVEDGQDTLRFQATSIGNSKASREAAEVLEILESIQESLKLWRQEYPDTSPVKIDNSEYFKNPGDGQNTPTLIAYCLALVSRVFERTAQRGATFVLKMMKMFGYSLATLGGRNLNAQQEAALASIPESIERLEKKFNLDIEGIPYAVCPDCSCTYPPSYPNGPSSPTYPSICLEKKALSAPPCGASLLSYGKPIKVFEYYPFFDWFGKFIALPGIEEYGDRFCEAIDQHQTVPTDKVNTADGRFVHEFRGADGRLFVRDRETEGRWFFILNADFFNVEGNRIRGKASSTGMLAMTCLNLPLEIRNDHAYLYIPGIIQGPQEPKAENAEHRHYLKPLIDDLLVGYMRGVRPYATHRTHGDIPPHSRAFRIALAAVLMDFKAARPHLGLLDVTSHHICSGSCDCWHTSGMGRTDYENWKPIDDEFLRKGAELWRNADDVKDRGPIEDLYGTRDSALWQLPYWKPSCQGVVDPMHTMFLILLQRYFRDILGLDNPDDSKRKPKKPRFRFAFYHDFVPPPPLASLREVLMADLSRSMNYHSAASVGNIHRLLQQPLVRGQEDDLRNALMHSSGDALAYVCTDLQRLPANRFAKDDMVNQLMLWRLEKPLDPMVAAKIDSSALLKRIQQVVREAVTPSWMTNPPADVGLAKAGTLKADHWRRLFAVHVPLAVLSLWRETSPLASPDAHRMASVVDTTMHLSCASLIMTKRSLSLERRNLFRHLLRLHVLGLRQDFPGWIFPSHHLAFHIFDGMENYSGVRNCWCFPFEFTIGKLQRIPNNHIPGQFERTMLHSFCKGATFRQWLMRRDAPPILRYCLELVDQAYNYYHTPMTPPTASSASSSTADDVDSTESEPLTAAFVGYDVGSPDSKHKIPSPPDLTKLVGEEPTECYSRVPGSKGYYTIPKQGATGNSYICFQSQGKYQPGQPWKAGQIQHIFRKTSTAQLQVAVRVSQATNVAHPFSDFAENGFEAAMFSTKFSKDLEVLNFNQIAAHAARWNLTDELVAVVNLCMVSRLCERVRTILNIEQD